MTARKARPVQTHRFVPDRDAGEDFSHRGVCAVPGCGLPEANAHHQAGEVDADQAEHRRRIGEEGGGA